jgi:hypothetical protein
MKVALNTASSRNDLRMAARCMDKNGRVAAEVFSDAYASDAHRYQAKRLMEVTELNMMAAVQAYLGQL